MYAKRHPIDVLPINADEDGMTFAENAEVCHKMMADRENIKIIASFVGAVFGALLLQWLITASLKMETPPDYNWAQGLCLSVICGMFTYAGANILIPMNKKNVQAMVDGWKPVRTIFKRELRRFTASNRASLNDTSDINDIKTRLANVLRLEALVVAIAMLNRQHDGQPDSKKLARRKKNLSKLSEELVGLPIGWKKTFDNARQRLSCS